MSEPDIMTMNMLDAIKYISQGNPGALHTIMRVHQKFEDWVFPCFLHDLQRKGLIGYKIWELYKDVHKEDHNAFCEDVWTGAPLHNFLRKEQK